MTVIEEMGFLRLENARLRTALAGYRKQTELLQDIELVEGWKARVEELEGFVSTIAKRPMSHTTHAGPALSVRDVEAARRLLWGI